MAQAFRSTRVFTAGGLLSHRPDEYASPEWIASGVDVLARTLAKLAG